MLFGFGNQMDIDNIFAFMGITAQKEKDIHIAAVQEAFRQTRAVNSIAFARYCKHCEKHNVAPVEYRHFKTLLKAIAFFDISGKEKLISTNNQILVNAIINGANTLYLSANDIAAFLLFIMRNTSDKAIDKWLEDNTISPFFKGAQTEMRKILISLRREFFKATPLNALCAIELLKKTKAYRKNSEGGISTYHVTAERSNDFALENGFVFPMIASNTLCDEPAKYIVFAPSSAFVRKWCMDKALLNLDTVFVIPNYIECETLSLHFSNAKWCGYIRKNITFVCLDDLAEECYENTNILVFANHLSDAQKEAIFKHIFANTVYQNNKIFVVGSDKDLTNTASLITENNYGLSVSECLLLPSGIGGTKPKKKVFFCVQPSSPKSEKHLTTIAECKIFDNNEVPLSLCIDTASKQKIDFSALANPTTSPRSLYRKKVSEMRSKTTRSPSKSINFSKELVVKYNASKGRVQAYFLDKNGKKLIESAKQGYIGDDLEKWLTKEYPFSTPRGERNGIRSVVSKHYSDAFFDKDISFRTFWYLHPEFDEKLSKKDRALLFELAMGPLGEMFLSADNDAFVDRIIALYPEDNTATRHAKFVLLLDVFDATASTGNCTSNPFKAIFEDERTYNKAFRALRDAMAKKFFSKKEYAALLDMAISNWRNQTNGAIGVLLMLLTPLGANVICGLCWEDLHVYFEGQLYVLSVYSELTVNGKERKRFSKIEQCISFPCSTFLQNVLLAEREKCKQALGEDYLKSSIVSWRNEAKGADIISPYALTKLCKDVIKQIGINDDIIELPDIDNGISETNLNRYSGDIFRENFRYWAFKMGRMTADEVAYLLGNKGVTTFGRHYCDYKHPNNLLSLHQKLNRFHIAAVHKSLETNAVSFEKDVATVFLGKDSKPLRLLIKIDVDTPKELIFNVSNKYGMEIRAKYEEVDNG